MLFAHHAHHAPATCYLASLTRHPYLHLPMQIVLASRKRLHNHPIAGCEVSVGTGPQGDPDHEPS